MTPPVELLASRGNLDVYQWGPIVVAVRIDIRVSVHAVYLRDPEALGFGWPWIEATDWDRGVARRQAEYRQRKRSPLPSPSDSSTR